MSDSRLSAVVLFNGICSSFRNRILRSTIVILVVIISEFYTREESEWNRKEPREVRN